MDEVMPQERTMINFQMGVANSTAEAVDNLILQRASEIVGKLVNEDTNYSDSKSIMDIPEACHFFKDISAPTLNKFVRQGLPKHKTGGKVFYLRRECLDFIAMLPSD